MGMVSEFKEFIARGNVIDLAVGVVIGAAFGKIVTALVDGIVMPALGMLTGGVDISDLKVVLSPAGVDAAGAEIAEVAIRYGAFIQTVVDFVLIAFVIFLFIKGYNRLKKSTEAEAEAAPAEPSEDILLLREIRDSLKRG
ncbi:large-conductance mechanosensitive channel protein MscL [Marilutibacter chinensis]|uniref:Large-conductance mechanosensitive channel n=1 Tax=Marilutibacter chinensis TaxID=2912247 RepID=A0ABS9HXB7_9GAMM|nr:large-conductance mechanosensitive channel protein MscL [Lysobacter chinensis]MCF7223388.1 large-conductance mechanosensitive channel protein MscL [Lysobacter chinensis]